MARLAGRKGIEKFERVGFLRRVSAMYDRLASEDPSYVVVDASLPKEEVIEAVWNAVGKE